MSSGPSRRAPRVFRVPSAATTVRLASSPFCEELGDALQLLLAWLLGRLRRQLIREFRDIDDDPLVRADTNLFGSIHCPNLELDVSASDLGHFGGRCDAPADRGGRQVLHVDACTNGALTGLEVRLDAFSIAMIMTGVANTAGSVASLNRLARCSAETVSVNEPLAPGGIGRTVFPSVCEWLGMR
jgi:hypothetical protein